jgi:hypothetical protein
MQYAARRFRGRLVPLASRGRKVNAAMLGL